MRCTRNILMYIIKPETMFAVRKIPPAVRSKEYTTSSFKRKLFGNNAEFSRVNRNTL